MDRNQLVEGLHALDLTLDDEDSVVDQLLRFYQLVIKWNKTYNLTSIVHPKDFLVKHILDSLSLLPALKKNLGAREINLLDIGSGAGLPGIVLAIADKKIKLTSVDSSQKRIAFQKQVVRELGLDYVTPIHSRIENISDQSFDIITGRAFSSISQLVASSQGLLNSGGSWLLMKGTYPQKELLDFQQDVRFGQLEAEVIPLEVPLLDAERHLVKINSY